MLSFSAAGREKKLKKKMKRIILLFLLVLVLVGCSKPPVETVVLYRNVNKTVNVTVIKEVNRTVLVNVTCPVVNVSCPECVTNNITCEVNNNYLLRMYGCENKIKRYENLNSTFYQDNLSTELRVCTAQLLQANYTINQIRSVIE